MTIAPTWICCQIGAREHYSIPRALHQNQELFILITDSWVSPQSIFSLLPQQKLKERFHTDLALANIESFNSSSISFELRQRFLKRTGWELTIARNKYFQDRAIHILKNLVKQLKTPPIIFSYSYAALYLFRFAKAQGWHTILGQIDPGIQEELIVRQEHHRYPQYQKNWHPAPSSYWRDWKEECDLADCIIVNSDWSFQLLKKEGIEYGKIKIIPLAYTPIAEAHKFTRTYPSYFSRERPLRVLFLGQVLLRKGIASVLDALKYIEGLPVEFWVVGSLNIEVPEYLKNHVQIHWKDQVNRSQTSYYYQQADVFLFPTLSDGFGLTQLEAQSWKLPVITSCNCGEVITHGVNGLILDEVSGESISNSIKISLERPRYLQELSDKSGSTSDYSLTSIWHKLQEINFST